MAVKKVEVCVSNVDLGSGAVCDLIAANYPDIKIRRWGCLGYCHRCVHVPFVIIDDKETIEAESAEDLWSKVQAFIDGAGDSG